MEEVQILCHRLQISTRGLPTAGDYALNKALYFPTEAALRPRNRTRRRAGQSNWRGAAAEPSSCMLSLQVQQHKFLNARCKLLIFTTGRSKTHATGGESRRPVVIATQTRVSCALSAGSHDRWTHAGNAIFPGQASVN